MWDKVQLQGSPQRKWRRTGKPKSTTGCQTCRRRRVKCDEGKPACIRCIKAGTECEGYIPSKKAPELLPKGLRTILAKPNQKSGGLLKPAPGGTLVASDIEGRYMAHFQHRASSGFEGMIDWSLWKYLVLQLCHRESFVRDSVIAIGALVKSVETIAANRALPTNDGRLLGLATMHRRFALMKYGKAVHAMQLVLSTAKPREILIACILIFSFEILLNNRHLALSHIVTGHRLLHNWRGKQPENSDIDTHGLLSPAPLNVDNELVEAFEHLNLQISTVFDPRPVEFHREIISEGRHLVQLMPAVFDDMTQAQRYLTAVMRRCHHFLATSWCPSEALALYRKFVNPPGDVVVTTGVNIYSTTFKVSDTLREEVPEYMNEISRWSRSFEPLFRKSRSVDEVHLRNRLVGALLQLHATATKIVVAGVLFTVESSYDAFLPEFREMIALTNIIVNIQHLEKKDQNVGLRGFMLDLGIVAPLFLLCLRCRDSVLRRRAIEVLSSWHDESFWQPAMISELCRFIMDVEEAGMIDGHIPESSRAVITAVCEGTTPDNGGPTEVLIQCVQRFGSPDGGPIWHERMIRYYTIPKPSNTEFGSG